MALGSKTSTKFFSTSGGGGDEINSTRKTDLEAIATSEASEGSKNLINDPTLGPLVLNAQRMQDDLDEVRRYLLDSANPPLLYSKITISSGEMAALALTRKTLVAAPGADKLIVPVSIVIMCEKLNTTPNTTLTNLFAGYYNNDNRDITRTPTHATLGLLYQARSDGSYNVNPVATAYFKKSLIVNKEFAMLLSIAPGSNGATTSEVLFSYYIADVS